MPFFTAAILLCAVKDAQCRTSECSRARKKCRAVVPGTSRFSCWARKLPSWKQEVTLGKTMWELLAHRTSMDISMGHASSNFLPVQPRVQLSWSGQNNAWLRGLIPWVQSGGQQCCKLSEPLQRRFLNMFGGGNNLESIHIFAFNNWQWFINHVNHVYI